jgi:hypothetical protein
MSDHGDVGTSVKGCHNCVDFMAKSKVKLFVSSNDSASTTEKPQFGDDAYARAQMIT